MNILNRLMNKLRKPPFSTRYELIQYLIDSKNYKSYLEIGCSKNLTFERINVASKIGVDPKSGGTIRATSDEFFSTNSEKFDLIFIDGLHQSEQVIKDIKNALNFLYSEGAIVLHDCSPISKEAQIVPRPTPGAAWNGDVWRAILLYRKKNDLDIGVGDFDYGCGVIFKRKNSKPLDEDISSYDIKYEDFDGNRKSLINLMSANRLKENFIDLGK